MSGVSQPDLAGSIGIGNFRPAQAVTVGLKLERYAPGAALRPYVQCYWQARWQGGGGKSAGMELLHPDGATGLLFNFGATLERDGERVHGDCWIDGPKRSTARLAVGTSLDLLGVRFLPGMAFPFVGDTLSALAGEGLTPGDALRRLELDALHERLWRTPDLAERLALLDEYLLDRLRHSERVPSGLMASLGWLQRHHGQGSIAALVDELPFGQRRLERLFQRHVGLSPKRYARLLRVAHSRELIKQSGATTSLTDTAFAVGYFDQSHFIHDFKAVTGFTPGGYLDHVQRRYGRQAQQ
ncbi:helix-turn-helix domain-containing protein [Billgrantia bachuensis]|uniref:Helix-turn-helix transcriptional regulator n=1 Tax=Billgrantia bachuensis TaxID=2717286 RepID=A0ABX0PQK9_9GAMM|nr:helix-turn-helix domain-containing protein [Halomonas bachuensis]NIC04840.1 helix-turn-helix transcriptional regulator [Halomonas bachuensis]